MVKKITKLFTVCYLLFFAYIIIFDDLNSKSNSVKFFFLLSVFFIISLFIMYSKKNELSIFFTIILLTIIGYFTELYDLKTLIIIVASIVVGGYIGGKLLSSKNS